MKNIFSTGDAIDQRVGAHDVTPDHEAEVPPLEEVQKNTWAKMWPVLACGAGLFSDGFLNNIIGSVSTILGIIYPTEYANSPAESNVSSITFAGTVLGMLVFGYTSDAWSRKWSLFISTIILLIFAALAAGSYGAGGSINGMFAALTAYRFFIGIGIGGEYPAGSVACSEATGELKSGTRNRWFVLFTNNMIDIGFVVSAFVPMIVVLATGEDHLRAAWRICLGLGVIPPLSLLYLRLKLKEPEAFKRQNMRKAKTPWVLIIKFYWFRLAVVSLIWFLYDFSSYSFGIYSSRITANLVSASDPLWVTFGWNTVINLFYLPGSILGAFVSDWIGPKKALAYGVTAQAIVGFILAGVYPELYKPEYVGGFVVVYGVFLALGELGPGDNIGLIASKTCATAVRGRYYGIAAGLGKVGAYVGTKVLGILYDHYANGGDVIKAGQIPVFVSSGLCVLSALVAWFLLPNIGQDTIDHEDVKFRQYLIDNGYDITQLGDYSDTEQMVRESSTEEAPVSSDEKAREF